MTMIRITTVDPALNVPGTRARALDLVRRASAAGLLRDHGLIQRLDLALLRSIAHEAATEGVGQEAALTLLDEGARPDQVAAAISQLDDALSESPIPARELQQLLAIEDVDQLADWTGSSAVSLRRYAAGTREMPDELAERIHWLALVVADLAGAYNQFGIRRWFERPRAQLDGRAPRDFLHGRWDPESGEVEGVRRLAEALAGPGALT
jgi:uncharacterized protein (DUF2384 family)